MSESINITRRKAVKVYADAEGHDPRGWYNLGTMACWHRRHALGDIHPQEDPRAYEDGLPDGVTLPLYLYDHSGLTMRTTPFSCPWDSGQVGLIHCSLERARDERHGRGVGATDDEVREWLRMMLIDEVETYDAYLRGAVYGFVVVDQVLDEDGNILKEEHIDGCGGFYDTESYSALEGMLEHLDEGLHPLLAAAFEDRA